MGNFPIAHAEGINLVKEDGTEDNLQNLFNNGELGGGGDSSVTLTQTEYEALPEEEKLDGLYYTYDTKRIYKNGVQYGASEPIPLTMEEYKALKAAGAIDEQQEYLVEADAEGILLGAEDIGYSNAESGIQATTVQGAVDKVNDKVDNELATKLDKRYITGITDANNAIGENGVNIFVMSASSSNLPISRTGVIRSYTTIENKYIRVNQEYSTIDNAPQIGGTYKRYGASDDGGVTFTWSNWNFVGSIDDNTTAALKTWSSSKIAEYVAENAAPTYSGTVIPTKIAKGSTITTDWNILNGGDNADNSRLLLLNSKNGSFLLHIRGNLSAASSIPSTLVSSVIVSQSYTWSTDFELSVSSDYKLRIKNKSTAVASWRFV
jgi:hypothetical protein